MLAQMQTNENQTIISLNNFIQKYEWGEKECAHPAAPEIFQLCMFSLLISRRFVIPSASAMDAKE